MSTEPSTLRRVAKNTAVPTATSIVNKGLDLVFAVVLARSLGPTELGRYTWVVLVVGYFDILVNFGLGILIARQVARDAASAPRYMGAAAVARASLWLVSLAASLVIAGPLAGPIGITPEMGIALAVFTVGIGVSNLSGICSAVFNGREMMEYPALVTVFTSALKLALGAAALVAGYGIIGVALVSIVVNLVSGSVHLTFNALGPLAQFVQSGRVKMLATTAAQRIPQLPDLHTIAESGVPGFEATGWYGFFTTAGVPRDVLEKLNGSISAAKPCDIGSLVRTMACAIGAERWPLAA